MIANIHFILVRPEFLGNIGATARVLKNFGFSNLRLVQPPRNYKDAEARQMSVGAFDILKSGVVFGSLADALKDISYAIGTSSGHQRTQPLADYNETLAGISETVAHNDVAIVFGDEKNGLGKEELERCNVVVRIPTASEFPSMNIAQAVCIFAYELSKITNESNQVIKPQVERERPTGLNDDEITAQLNNLLEHVEFSRKFNKELVLRQLLSFYKRADPTKREGDLLRGILYKLNQSLLSSREFEDS
jgi:TrmH family RNA methyltransferase